MVDPDFTNRPYQLISATDYLNANQYAVDNGGWLWTVNSEEEQIGVLDAFRTDATAWRANNIVPAGFAGEGQTFAQAEGLGNVWVGLNDSPFFGNTEGNFSWINPIGGVLDYENFGGGEPNDFDTGEDYTEVGFGSPGVAGGWNDDNDRGSGLDSALGGGTETDPGDPLKRLPGGEGNFAVIEFPPVPPIASLVIDPDNGWVELIPDNTLGIPLEVYSYEITSDPGVVSPSTWESTNLASRGVDAIDPGTPGQQWESIVSSDDRLLEGFLFGGSELEPGETLKLGQIAEPFDATDLDPSDFGFGLALISSSRNAASDSTLSTPRLPITFGDVIPPDPPTDRADFNGDGTVDLLDLDILGQNFGLVDTATMAQGDANGDGDVDLLDLDILGQEFDSGGSAAVPEPTALTLAVPTLVLLRRRVR